MAKKIFSALERRGVRGLDGRGLAQRHVKAAIACVGGASLFASTVHAQEAWKIVVPWRTALVSVDVPVLFANELTQVMQSPVVVDEATYSKQDEALAWSLASAAASQPSLVLFSEELALTKTADIGSSRHISHYEPLMLIWQTRWCLFGLKDSPLQRPGALRAWMQNKPSMHKVAIPEGKGRLSIWIRGLELHTQSRWEVHTYGLTGGIVQALENGVDVAVSFCNRQRLHPEKTQILAQSGPARSEMLPDVPLFTEVGWAPLAKGWMAWMTPKTTPLAQREKMAEALYRVMGQPHVQAQLRGTGHVVQHMDAKTSKRHIESFTQVWNGIDELFETDR